MRREREVKIAKEKVAVTKGTSRQQKIESKVAKDLEDMAEDMDVDDIDMDVLDDMDFDGDLELLEGMGMFQKHR